MLRPCPFWLQASLQWSVRLAGFIGSGCRRGTFARWAIIRGCVALIIFDLFWHFALLWFLEPVCKLAPFGWATCSPSACGWLDLRDISGWRWRERDLLLYGFFRRSPKGIVTPSNRAARLSVHESFDRYMFLSLRNSSNILGDLFHFISIFVSFCF